MVLRTVGGAGRGAGTVVIGGSRPPGGRGTNADLPTGSHDHSIKEALSPTPAVADLYGRWQGASSDAIPSVVGREGFRDLACSAGYDRCRRCSTTMSQTGAGLS